jgi:hypothetical protein
MGTDKRLESSFRREPEHELAESPLIVGMQMRIWFVQNQYL